MLVPYCHFYKIFSLKNTWKLIFTFHSEGFGVKDDEAKEIIIDIGYSLFPPKNTQPLLKKNLPLTSNFNEELRGISFKGYCIEGKISLNG